MQDNLKEKAEGLLNYLKDHEIIDTLCYIPLNMSIVVYLSKSDVKLKDLPNNQTELTKQAVRMTVLHNLVKLKPAKSKDDSKNLKITTSKNDLKNLPEPFNEIFYYLSELAYKALYEKKLTFTRDEIRKACPVETNGDEKIKRAIINGLGLLHAAQFLNEGDGNTELLSNFAHYSVQELLAAWYIAFRQYSYCQLLPVPCTLQKGMQNCLRFLFQSRILKANFWKGDHINVWSFYVGLTGGNDLAFKHFLTSNIFSCYTPCKTFSKVSSYILLQEATPNDIPEFMEVVQCTKKTLKSKLKVLLLCYVLQEAPDSEVIKHFDAVITKDTLDISEQVLELKQDLYLLGNILSRPYLTKQWKLVNLSYCDIDDEKFRTLHEVLTRNDGRFKPKIEMLSLSGNKLKSCSDAIANLACCQEILHLDLSKNVLENFVSLQRCDFLETLDISNNKLDNTNVAISFNGLRILRKLKVLKMKHNNIGNNQDAIDAIGLALCSCNCLEELELDGNDRGFVEKTVLLFKVINEIRNSKSDEHHYNGQPDKASAFLKILEHCNKIDYQPDLCTLRNIIIQSKKIDISCSGLKTDDGCLLGQNLTLLVNLKSLDISKNNISDEATKSLTTGMLFTHNLEEFKYDTYLFSDDSIMIINMITQLRTSSTKHTFKCAPPEIEALLFILNYINDNEEKVQTSDIVSTIGLIKELNLSHNEPTMLDYKLTSENITELCIVLRWFKQLEVLDVSNNEITIETKQPMTKAMLQIHTLNCMKLTGNPISNDELCIAIFDNIKNVRENQLQSIVYNQKNSSHIQCQSILYAMECLSQLENPTSFKSFDNISTVDIDLQSIDDGTKFLKYLIFLPFLKKLRIINAKCITDCGINQINEYLSQNGTLKTLELSYCNLISLELEDRCSSIGIPLEVVKFNHSNVTDNALLKLSLNMLKFTNLNQLHLEGNLFRDKGITSLYNALLGQENDQPTTTITALNLADNQLTKSSAVELIKIVERCTVKYLNISKNYLGCIFSYFEDCTITTLEVLDFSTNNYQTDNALKFAESIQYLSSCSSLKKLNISNNSINETALDVIFCSFMKCIHFEEVICKNNPAENEIELTFHLVKNLHNQQDCVKSITLKQRPKAVELLISKLALPYKDQIGTLATSAKTQVSQVTSIDFSYNDMKIDKNFI